MARKKKPSTWETFKTRSRSNLAAGALALGVIVLAFFLINSFIQNSPDSKTDKPKEKETTTSTQTKLENTDKSRSQVHIVVRGENLSKLAEKYYGDKNKWTVIAAENKISDPNLITVGTNLNIPDLESQTSSINTQTPPKVESTSPTVNQPKTYTVVRGDTLWEISQHFYSGDGYQWFRIRDANSSKVGLLPNGRPLITPGTVLTIPNLN